MCSSSCPESQGRNSIPLDLDSKIFDKFSGGRTCALCLIRHMKTAIKFFDCVAMKPKNPGNFQGPAHTGFAGFVGKTSFRRWFALLAAALAKGAGAASTAAQALALLLYSCVPPESGGGTENTGAENNYGYANATFRYFYYPADNQIYYISENDIYKMDTDGTSASKIKDNTQQDTTDNMYKRQYIYVFDGTVYYNDRVSNTTHKMRTDGKNHATEANGKSGQMGAYGLSPTLYFDGRKRHLMGNTLYYSTDSTTLGKKSPPNANTATTITARQADNFVFAPDGIYFRLHASGVSSQSYYGIVKVRYDVAPQGTGNNARLTDAEEIISPTNPEAAVDPISSTVSGSGRNSIFDDFPILNVSRNFIAYLGRNSGDLIVWDRKTNTTRVAKAGIYKPDNTTGRRPKLPGGISIIGDYIYWMSETNKKYVFHRVKKDGTGYAQIKTIPY